MHFLEENQLERKKTKQLKKSKAIKNPLSISDIKASGGGSSKSFQDLGIHDDKYNPYDYIHMFSTSKKVKSMQIALKN